MGWDIEFCARFSIPEPPSQRFSRVYDAILKRSHFCLFTSFGVYKDASAIRKIVELSDHRGADGAVTRERVEEILREYASTEELSIRGTWDVAGERNGVATRGAVTICARGPKLSSQFALPMDVTWGVGDWRRYTAEGKERHPNTAQVMADVAILVEAGAESIWGVDSLLKIAPKHLFAVFHRDPNAFHDDGIDPPYVDVPIDSHLLDLVLSASPHLAGEKRTIQTNAGPIIYHEDLGNDDLRVFYAGLGGALEAVAEGVD